MNIDCLVNKYCDVKICFKDFGLKQWINPITPESLLALNRLLKSPRIRSGVSTSATRDGQELILSPLHIKKLHKHRFINQTNLFKEGLTRTNQNTTNKLQKNYVTSPYKTARVGHFDPQLQVSTHARCQLSWGTSTLLYFYFAIHLAYIPN